MCDELRRVRAEQQTETELRTALLEEQLRTAAPARQWLALRHRRLLAALLLKPTCLRLHTEP